MMTLVTTGSETPLAEVRNEIARACAAARRDPSEVTLVAISKMFGAVAIAPVIAAGQRVFGENRVQEAKAKWPALAAEHPGIEQRDRLLRLVRLQRPDQMELDAGMARP